ncbi:uncharacterized protein LTR77_007021 [Saxophila tyrrhenica]|uniref:Uncharacterized protein n=1 Tax=Saxophila tyrrhenica TaxID=1690608 RepID=A0AAV9PAP3_9PEZI|nr:hypothetical protein LTR77_007021 [Saxophila tyrrhenica]
MTSNHAHEGSPGGLTGLSLPLFATSILAALLAWLPWSRRWTYSGCALETLVLLYGHGLGSRILPSIHLWSLLTTFNLLYAVCSTSWLLSGLFTAACYPLIFVTCLCQFQPFANLARRTLRKSLHQLHFTKDKIGLFNLPALEIDTDVNGLLVVRGVTVSLSTLDLVAHGIELGIRLTDDIELAISVDEVKISLFRRIAIGEVFINLKNDRLEMMFDTLSSHTQTDAGMKNRSVLLSDTQTLKTAIAGAEKFTKEGELREQMTGGSHIEDVSASAALEPVELVELSDTDAEGRYLSALDEIRRTSAVGRGRSKAKENAQSKVSDETDSALDDYDGARALLVAELQALPSVPHPPSQSVRVTTLQTLAPPSVRRLLHRLPLLLRTLVLAPISYLHPITVHCVTAGLPGCWVSAILTTKVFKHYSETSAGIRRLEEKISSWLTDASFCLQCEDFEAVAQVPFSSAAEVSVQMKVKGIAAYRSFAGGEESQSSQVAQLDGADGSIALPMYLLPHHEHIIPEPGSDENGDSETDMAQIKYNVHAALPARLDNSLLSFVAALVKASKIIELEKDSDGEEDTISDATEPPTPTSPDSIELAAEQDLIASTKEQSKSPTRFKTFAKNLRQNVKDGTTGQLESIKEFAKDVNQASRDGVKKAIIVGVVNDGWIAKLVGKVAAKLEQAQGSFGYAGVIPIPLGPYRSTEDVGLAKLLP